MVKKLDHTSLELYKYPYQLSSRIPPSKEEVELERARDESIRKLQHVHTCKDKAKPPEPAKATPVNKGPYVVQRGQVQEYYTAVQAGLYPIHSQCRDYYLTELFQTRRKNNFPPPRELVWAPEPAEPPKSAWPITEERVKNAVRPPVRVRKNFKNPDYQGKPVPRWSTGKPKPTQPSAKDTKSAAKQAIPLNAKARKANAGRPVLAKARRRSRYGISGNRIE